MEFSEYDAPCGRLLIGVHGPVICLCDWMVPGRIEKSLGRIRRFLPLHQGADHRSLIEVASRQLDEFFAGNRHIFDIPVAARGSEFQRRVWDAIRRVTYGETASYKALAEAAGCPRGVRAVAAAVGANPVSILIPCHRIIGADGTLTGYAGGLEAKKYLLRLEGCGASGCPRPQGVGDGSR